jgi:hypothetical protein
LDLRKRLDLSREGRQLDGSGTPAAFIEQQRQAHNIIVLDSVDEADVLVDYPMGRLWRERTRCSRFVLLRRKRRGKEYALIRSEP